MRVGQIVQRNVTGAVAIRDSRTVRRRGSLEWCEAERRPRLFEYVGPRCRYRCATCRHPYVDDETFETNQKLLADAGRT